MIKAKFWLESENCIKRFIITGHAEFLEYGRDIVCSGVSAISQAGVIGLQHYFGDSVAVEQEEGRLTCELPELPSHEAAIAQGILMTMYLGLKAIEAGYSEYLQVTVEGGVLE